MTSQNEQLRTVIQSYFRNCELDQCLGVSLTLKQCVDGTFLDEIKASQNLRHFMNRLNSSVFGKAYQRFQKRLRVIPVLERSSTNRLHYHLILQSPYPHDPIKAVALIEDEWGKTRFGYRQTHVHQQIDHGWTDYITKSASDGVDWENYHWS